MIRYPLWIEALEGKRRDTERRLFAIRLSALLASPSGRLTDLSQMLGHARNYLSLVCHPAWKPGPGVLNTEDVIRIEQILTRDLMRREWLRPDVFLIPDSA